MRIIIDGAGKMRALAAVGYEATFGEVQKDGLVLGCGILKIMCPISRYFACAGYSLPSNRSQRIEVAQDDYSGGGGKERTGGHDREAKQFTPRNLLIPIPMIRKFGLPASARSTTKNAPSLPGNTIF